ncbi:MAG: sulfatase [Planctomycetales bacterium]|nr:sulfatase [Planctomycetales bacterium]
MNRISKVSSTLRLIACVGITMLALQLQRPMKSLAAEASRPNIILILCDNLGYGDIQPFGSTLTQTPALLRMQHEGRTFTHFYVSAGVCTPSRASIMTGCYAQRVGMHRNPHDGQVLRPVSPYGLNPQEQTVAEVLKSVGYSTYLIGKWHLGDQAEFLPTKQGFDQFFGIPYSDDMVENQSRGWPPLPLMIQDSVVEAPVDRNTLTRRYTQAALDFISRSSSPFFLVLSHAMPGSTPKPFSSPPFHGRSPSGPWADAVEEIDWSTGQILDQLVRLGKAEQTLVIFTSDNGAPNNPPGSPYRGSNAPLHGRGYSTSEAAFRVPSLMWWPGRIPDATTCSVLCSTLDLLPTWASLAGVPKIPEVDGYDIGSLMVDDDHELESPYEAFFYYEQDQLQAVRSGVWKLFLPLTKFERHPHFHSGQPNAALLFDVVADPGCENNLAAQNPEIVSRLAELAGNARRRLGDKDQPGTEQRLPGHITTAPRPQLFSNP